MKILDWIIRGGLIAANIAILHTLFLIKSDGGEYFIIREKNSLILYAEIAALIILITMAIICLTWDMIKEKYKRAKEV